MQGIAILGSTGSIGKQALEVISLHPDRFFVTALTAHRNAALLFEQVRIFRPKMAALTGEEAVVPADLSFCQFYFGPSALEKVAAEAEGTDVLAAVVGVAGSKAVLAARRAGKRVLLANKETLVAGGEMVMDVCREDENGPTLLPVDSEHSAIFQSLGGRLRHPELKRILLTASGGPFRGMRREEVYDKTPAQAVAHPNWNMGAKISVDSATMMNKGLELIEAMHLFGVSPDRISVLIHPQSVVHSGVEFCDGSVVVQMAVPNMGLPIQYAMTYPDRAPSLCEPLDLFSSGDLRFERPELANIPCLALAITAAQRGGTAPCILSAANEAAVALFLAEKIPFGKICECVAETLESIHIIDAPSLGDILEADRAAREYVKGLV